jgi:hypothetical protein
MRCLLALIYLGLHLLAIMTPRPRPYFETAHVLDPESIELEWDSAQLDSAWEWLPTNAATYSGGLSLFAPGSPHARLSGR